MSEAGNRIWDMVERQEMKRHESHNVCYYPPQVCKRGIDTLKHKGRRHNDGQTTLQTIRIRTKDCPAVNTVIMVLLAKTFRQVNLVFRRHCRIAGLHDLPRVRPPTLLQHLATRWNEWRAD
jgi:hypothetical protein